jgi:hypothetical protein
MIEPSIHVLPLSADVAREDEAQIVVFKIEGKEVNPPSLQPSLFLEWRSFILLDQTLLTKHASSYLPQKSIDSREFKVAGIICSARC